MAGVSSPDIAQSSANSRCSFTAVASDLYNDSLIARVSSARQGVAQTMETRQEILLKISPRPDDAMAIFSGLYRQRQLSRYR